MITVSTTTMKPILTLLTALLFAPLAAQSAEPMQADWMPRVEDGTGLWWVNGAPKVFQSDARPTEETLCLKFGKEKLLFDTRRVRPVEGEWECVVISQGRRFACSGHMQTDDEWHQPVRFVESGRLFQRVAIEALTFADAEGNAFGGTARLEISVWPDRLAFHLECAGDAVMELRHGAIKVTGGKSIVLEVHSGEAQAEKWRRSCR